MPAPSVARIAYLALMLLAAPAMLWTSFEVYGLTLRGEQMLFYSVVHTMPITAMVVFLSVPVFLLWAAVNAGLLAAGGMREAAGVTPRQLRIFLRFQVAHAAALICYETCSGVAALRVIICLIGLWLLWTALTAAIGNMLHPAPAEPAP